MDLIKDALWVLGDSFCAESDFPSNRWSTIVRNYLNDKYKRGTTIRKDIRYYNYAGGSMDTQTIIENWIKILPYIMENDAIIICVSDSSRARYPVKESKFSQLPHIPNDFNAPLIDVHFDYTPVGFDPTEPTFHRKVTEMDIPFENSIQFKDYIQFDNILLSSDAHTKNKIQLIEALYKITPCYKKFIYTWTVDYKSKFGINGILKSESIYSKDWLTKNVFDGKWEDLHEEFIKTNGKSGNKDDRHLSNGCEIMMSEYFIKEFEL